MILDKIDKLLKEVNGLTAKNIEEIEQLRLKYLSKKGEISALMADFREVSADQKKAVGIKINELKNLAVAKINELKEQHRLLLLHAHLLRPHAVVLPANAVALCLYRQQGSDV